MCSVVGFSAMVFLLHFAYQTICLRCEKEQQLRIMARVQE